MLFKLQKDSQGTCSYLAQSMILKEPAGIGHFQRISNFHRRALCYSEVLWQHCIQGRGAVALGNAHLGDKNWNSINLVEAQLSTPFLLMLFSK